MSATSLKTSAFGVQSAVSVLKPVFLLKFVRRLSEMTTTGVRPKIDIVERYGLGKPIHYTTCWHCWRFQQFKQCRYRKWIHGQLYCMLPAKYIDDRMKW
ncbi:hypothetical protein DRP04_03680 [Archaeoglobales archaeon]|nr:MAG: hypothetical protein DRP04_03680 [Archaeoglobales archaeon]